MNKKIIFVLNSIDTRCIKRVEEFIDNGYEVEVYGFGRGTEAVVESKRFSIKIIGVHDISMGYFKRSIIIFKSLKKLFKQYRHEDVVYFLFFFDVASISQFIVNKPFIYELSDMPYTHFGNSFIRGLFEKFDRFIIRRSLLTTLTSEGFLDYLFGEKHPSNTVIVPNKVDKRMLELPYKETPFNINHLRFSFVGAFRYQTTLNFLTVAAKAYPQHEFYADGIILLFAEELKQLENECPNVHVNGAFKYPDQMPSIYEHTDIVLANYDSLSINAQYAEPNKLYESIYFRTPIIVSSGTFLAKKVNKLGIGYDVDSYNDKEIVDFIASLTEKSINEKKANCVKIPIEDAISNDPALFEYLQNKMK